MTVVRGSGPLSAVDVPVDLVTDTSRAESKASTKMVKQHAPY